MSLQEIRDCFNKLAELCDGYDKAGLTKLPTGLEFKTRDILRLDVAKFIMYMCASDGTLTDKELQVYRYVTGYKGDTLQDLANNIKKYEIYSTAFESEPPLSLKIMAYAEQNFENDKDMLLSVVKMYADLGAAVAQIDGQVTSREANDFRTIITTMKQFVDDVFPS